jgi:DNA-binding transcriptional LysR family regulator
MNTKDPEYIITVVEEGNITSVSKRLFMSQPSLSHCIQRVEAELSTTLFIRPQSGIELTNAGRVFLETAEKVSKEYRDPENKLADISNLSIGYLAVGIPTLLNGCILPEGYMYFRQKHPPCENRLVRGRFQPPGIYAVPGKGGPGHYVFAGRPQSDIRFHDLQRNGPVCA